MTTILAFILVLGVLIILHEAGHFVAARAVGARVEVFSVGFGRRLFGVVRGDTDYRVSLIPFGGYVRVVGLGPDESDVTSAGDAPEDELLPRWKRAFILVAGPVANVVAAVAFLGVAFMIGVEVPRYRSAPPEVGWVEPDSPAAEAGIRPGDLVVALDGTRIESWRQLELETAIRKADGRSVEIEISRDGERLRLPVVLEAVSRYRFGYSGLLPPIEPVVVRLQPGGRAERAGVEEGDRILSVNGEPVDQFYDLIRLISPHPEETVTLMVERDGAVVPLEVVAQDVGGEGKIGIALEFPAQLRRLPPGQALVAGWHETVRMTRETFRVIGKLLTLQAPMSQMSGPIDIAFISGEAARGGIHQLIQLMGLISLQLGIFNLLPIPILDGGHLTILSVEAVARRDLSMKVKERILEVGFVLLMLLVAVVVFNDIAKRLPEGVHQMIFRG